MTTRTLKQQGQGYGNQPVTVIAKINGAVVYSGEIPTVDQPVPAFPNQEVIIDQDLFTWESTVDFSGTQNLEITVTSGTVILTDTLANYVFTPNPNLPPDSIPGGASVFDVFYSIENDGVVISDPFTNVVIDSVAQSPIRDSGLNGQWYWKIGSGSVFSTTVNIDAGFEVPAWDSGSTYNWGAWANYNDALYFCWKNSGSSAGTLPTTQTVWQPIPTPIWNINNSYALNDLVNYSSGTYQALQNITPGTDITNSTFWAERKTGYYPG
jgi:hypothetical protein